MSLFILVLLLGMLSSTLIYAQEATDAFRSTNYPLPRFVSLRASEAFVRTGPGTQYPVKWVYKQSGLPLEIILEYENWRKIRDFQGDEGWIHHTLLSGKRMGLIKGEEKAPVYSREKQDSRKLAFLEPGVLLSLEQCREGWCEIAIGDFGGWVQRKYIWGIYEREKFD